MFQRCKSILIVLPQSRKGSVKMKRIYIAGLDCSISDAIRYALAGNSIIVPEEKNGKASLELIIFTKKEAKAIYKEIFNGTDAKAKLVFNR